MNESTRFLADILTCEPDALPPESTALRDIAGWDSLKHVLLVVQLEKKLNAKLTADEIQEMITVADVARVFRLKGIDV